MLARVAGALYWAGREVERAACVARVLEVSDATSLEGALANGSGRSDVWEPTVAITADPDRFRALHRRAEARSVSWYLTFSDGNPDGVAACLDRARERTRSIRSRLPTEVFETVSAVARDVDAWGPQRIAREGLYAFCHEVRDGVARIDGTVDRCLRRDENWQLVRLGRHLERAVQTARLLAAHTARAATPNGDAGGIGDWRVVLRAASSYEAYLRVALPGRRHPSAPAFLLQDEALPASVTFCLAEVAAAVDELRRLGVAPADADARAAVFAASRATALAAQPAFAVHGLARLAEKLDAVHDALASTLIPTTELADGATHAQAVRQAQN